MSERLVVIGSQWGDEGKGKITDYFACRADMVVRYQGGNNAGHTVVFDGKKYSLQSIPSGIFNPKTKNVMGNGMVINPVSVIEELDRLHSQGITDYQLYISDRAAVVMPYHSALDGAYEALKGGSQIGTTKKGIGPAYSDKYSRVGIRMGDLLEPEYFAERLREALAIKNMELKMLGLQTFEFEAVYEQYMELAKKIGHMICDTSALINKALTEDKKILFEGAQGMMLCIDHGTYPFVSSSSTCTGGVCTGLGVAPNSIGEIFGIFKAYSTRVGSGPFPVELFDETGEKIRDIGHEYGAVTGRNRRCGWVDIVGLKYAIMVNGVTQLIMMKSDVLDTFETIKACVAYRVNGVETEEFPYSIEGEIEPIYAELPGWQCDMTKMTSEDEFPEEFNNYISFLEEELEVPIKIVSVGPDRDQTIERYND